MAKTTKPTPRGLTVEEGYRRLAFGPVGDAVRLAFWEEGDPLNPESLDLFNVSEIRRVKGGVEVRFYDRLAALDRLRQIQREEDRRETGFYDALLQSARALEEREEPWEEKEDGHDPA